MEPQDPKARNQAPISQALGEPQGVSEVRAPSCHEFAPNREVRTSDWRNYDVSGCKLPDRGLIADWQARRFVNALTYLVFVAIIFLCFRFVPLLAFLGPALAIVTVTGGRDYLNRRTRDKIRSRILSEQRDAEFPVAVHFEIGAVEYGQDIGNLSFQDGWLYFEGERSTFSLGTKDFSSRWGGPYRSNEVSTNLDLTPTGCAVNIRIESLSLGGSMLHRGIEAWIESTEPIHGISVLPPLRARNRLTYSRVQRSRAYDLAVGAVVLGLALDIVFESHFIASIVVLASTIGLTLAIYRAVVGRQWNRAMKKLEEIQSRLEGMVA